MHIGNYPTKDLGHLCPWLPCSVHCISFILAGLGICRQRSMKRGGCGTLGSARRSNHQGHALLCSLAIIIYYYHLLLPLIAGQARAIKKGGGPEFHANFSSKNYTFGPFESFHYQCKIVGGAGTKEECQLQSPDLN